MAEEFRGTVPETSCTSVLPNLQKKQILLFGCGRIGELVLKDDQLKQEGIIVQAYITEKGGLFLYNEKTKEYENIFCFPNTIEQYFEELKKRGIKIDTIFDISSIPGTQSLIEYFKSKAEEEATEKLNIDVFSITPTKVKPSCVKLTTAELLSEELKNLIETKLGVRFHLDTKANEVPEFFENSAKIFSKESKPTEGWYSGVIGELHRLNKFEISTALKKHLQEILTPESLIALENTFATQILPNLKIIDEFYKAFDEASKSDTHLVISTFEYGGRNFNAIQALQKECFLFQKCECRQDHLKIIVYIDRTHTETELVSKCGVSSVHFFIPIFSEKEEERRAQAHNFLQEVFKQGKNTDGEYMQGNLVYYLEGDNMPLFVAYKLSAKLNAEIFIGSVEEELRKESIELPEYKTPKEDSPTSSETSLAEEQPLRSFKRIDLTPEIVKKFGLIRESSLKAELPKGRAMVP